MSLPAIATVTLNPAIDQTVSIPNFRAGEVNRVAWEQSDAGGKGVNVASFLAGFGYPVTVTGFLGKDNLELFQALFAQAQIRDRFVYLPGKTRVNVKIVDGAQNQVTDINFPGQTATLEDVTRLMEAVDAIAAECDWFILSGSIPASIPSTIYRELVGRLKSRGKRVVLDTSGEGLAAALPAAPDVIKPNLEELRGILNRSLETESAVLTAAHQLVEQGIHSVVVSMGAEGALFVEAQEAVLAVPPAVDIKSTVGAGDAMVAGVVAGKTRGLALDNCARLATAFSMGALMQVGPRLPPPSTVESLMDQVTIRRL